jgi:hypothetical protein
MFVDAEEAETAAYRSRHRVGSVRPDAAGIDSVEPAASIIIAAEARSAPGLGSPTVIDAVTAFIAAQAIIAGLTIATLITAAILALGPFALIATLVGLAAPFRLFVAKPRTDFIACPIEEAAIVVIIIPAVVTASVTAFAAIASTVAPAVVTISIVATLIAHVILLELIRVTTRKGGNPSP